MPMADKQTRSNELGTLLVTKRRVERWSLRDAAERIGVSHSTLSEIERGLRRPDFETLVGISEAYKVPIGTVTEMAARDAGLLKEQTSFNREDQLAQLTALADSFPALRIIAGHLLALPPEHLIGVLTYLEMMRSQGGERQGH